MLLKACFLGSPLSTWDFRDTAGWTTARRNSAIDWHTNNAIVEMLGGTRDSFFEDLLHEDGLGARLPLVGGGMVRALISC